MQKISVMVFIKFLINKYNIDLKLNFKKIKINPTVVGNNNLAKKKLLWSHKKNIYIATDEIYKFFIKNLKLKLILSKQTSNFLIIVLVNFS